MASGYDRNFDADRAKIWKVEVENELNAVSSVLRSVNELCSSDPIEGDPILEGMMDVNQVLQERWNDLSKGFETVIDGLDDIIDNIVKTVEENLDKINVFKDKAKQL